MSKSKKSESVKKVDDAKAPEAKATAARKGAKKPKAKKAGKKQDQPRRLSAIDAAAKILAEAEGPMRAQELIAAMEEKGLWKSPQGKTPSATLYAAMLREIKAKGKEARFQKVDRGMFASAKGGK